MSTSDKATHKARTVTTEDPRRPFAAECSCGWRSADVSNSGMAAGLSAAHVDHPTGNART